MDKLYFLSVFVTLIFATMKVQAKDLEAAKECMNIIHLWESMQKCCPSIKWSNHNDHKDHPELDLKNLTCEMMQDMATKHGNMKGDDIVYENFANILEMFVENSPDMEGAVEKAIDRCFDDKFQGDFPEDTCTLFKFFTCLQANIGLNCPDLDDGPECDELTKTLKSCKKLYN